MNENTSGKGKESEVPNELKKWNWGAFCFSWIWGIFNNTYRAFLVFIPLVGFLYMIVLGVKGSEWAWRHKKWDSIEHFQATQKKWAKAVLFLFAFLIVVSVSLFFILTSVMKNSEAYKTSLALVSADPVVSETIGSPLEAGWVMGSINRSGANGSASMNYKITGPVGSGKVYADSTLRRGLWTVDCLEVQLPDNSRTQVVQCDDSK